MNPNTALTPTESLAIQQATTIVEVVIRQAVVDGLRAAETCRCRSCRARAAQTFEWAVAMLGLDDRARADQGGPETT